MVARSNSTNGQRRDFLKTAGAAMLASAIPWSQAKANEFAGQSLQVWSCGGLAEAFMQANALYEEKTGITISYTGAFAAALGKSLLANGRTEVFAGRVLELAQKLRSAGKMVFFKPLCFTQYVMITPKGNPAGINTIQDLARPGVKVVLAPDASPPGGAAVLKLLEKTGVKDAALANTVVQGSCVQEIMTSVIDGTGDVAVVEKRLTRIPNFLGQTEVVPLPDNQQPPPPLPFTIGMMEDAQNPDVARDYIAFILSEQGQACFERQGFIPALSARGQELVEKLGVKDA
ncbi:MAG: substrate-binding domain-containing protein [Candidatus Electrothrix aestuarii]|uniref:Substrate-binding domain-containing protein n=1 Tax=Candidatus Electrothrix aestuarii TaxID=3062594 RepID=A0AAU8LW76_9BACT|nr:substrate-binding domain-containing protein [Candidatus Electrothrix aestuarii]